jgi:hypothetical protein
MSGIIQTALTTNGDPYAPVVSKPEAQSWDNYQIHDLYCIDIEYIGTTTYSGFPSEQFKKFLAVEMACPSGAILCDFEAIAIAYP